MATMILQVAMMTTIILQVADLKKKLNKLRYETGRKTSRIEALMKQYEKVQFARPSILSSSLLRWCQPGMRVRE